MNLSHYFVATLITFAFYSSIEMKKKKRNKIKDMTSCPSTTASGGIAYTTLPSGVDKPGAKVATFATTMSGMANPGAKPGAQPQTGSHSTPKPIAKPGSVEESGSTAGGESSENSGSSAGSTPEPGGATGGSKKGTTSLVALLAMIPTTPSTSNAEEGTKSMLPTKSKPGTTSASKIKRMRTKRTKKPKNTEEAPGAKPGAPPGGQLMKTTHKVATQAPGAPGAALKPNSSTKAKIGAPGAAQNEATTESETAESTTEGEGTTSETSGTMAEGSAEAEGTTVAESTAEAESTAAEGTTEAEAEGETTSEPETTKSENSENVTMAESTPESQNGTTPESTPEFNVTTSEPEPFNTTVPETSDAIFDTTSEPLLSANATTIDPGSDYDPKSLTINKDFQQAAKQLEIGPDTAAQCVIISQSLQQAIPVVDSVLEDMKSVAQMIPAIPVGPVMIAVATPLVAVARLMFRMLFASTPKLMDYGCYAMWGLLPKTGSEYYNVYIDSYRVKVEARKEDAKLPDNSQNFTSAVEQLGQTVSILNGKILDMMMVPRDWVARTILSMRSTFRPALGPINAFTKVLQDVQKSVQGMSGAESFVRSIKAIFQLFLHPYVPHLVETAMANIWENMSANSDKCQVMKAGVEVTVECQ